MKSGSVEELNCGERSLFSCSSANSSPQNIRKSLDDCTILVFTVFHDTIFLEKLNVEFILFSELLYH